MKDQLGSARRLQPPADGNGWDVGPLQVRYDLHAAKCCTEAMRSPVSLSEMCVCLSLLTLKFTYILFG